MIKLSSLLPKFIREAVDLPPASMLIDPKLAHHAYAKAAGDQAGQQYFQGNIGFAVDEKRAEEETISKARAIIMKFENSKENRNGGFDKNQKRWLPHKSLEGGSDTIAYGHKIVRGEESKFSNGISDEEAIHLLSSDIKKSIEKIKRNVPNFYSLPITVRIASVNAAFRGDLGPKTMALLSQNQFDKAAREYLNHSEYRSTSNRGVKKRMEWNAAVFGGAA